MPAVALAALAEAPRVLAPALDPELRRSSRAASSRSTSARCPDGATIAAPDAEAHRIARALPGAETLPGREALRARAIGAEVAALAEVGLRLRRDCPWDREQTAATIVPHTIEEAFEVADAVASGGEGLSDELGDLLFQSVFLAQLLEEEGARRPGVGRARPGRQARQPPPARLRRRGRRDRVRRRRPLGAAKARGARRPGDSSTTCPPACRRWPSRPRRRSAPPRPGSTTRTPPRRWPSSTRRRPSCGPTPAPASSATSSSPPWPSPAPSAPTPSWRSEPPRSASGRGWRGPPGWPPRPGTTSRRSRSGDQLRWYEASRAAEAGRRSPARSTERSTHAARDDRTRPDGRATWCAG